MRFQQKNRILIGLLFILSGSRLYQYNEDDFRHNFLFYRAELFFIQLYNCQKIVEMCVLYQGKDLNLKC